MIHIILLIILTVWPTCFVLSWGIALGAHKASDYSWLSPGSWKLIPFMILTAPIFLAAVISVHGIKHWAWWPDSKQKRFAIFQRDFAMLNATIDDFDKRQRA
jgi:hypothetical protein